LKQNLNFKGKRKHSVCVGISDLLNGTKKHTIKSRDIIPLILQEKALSNAMYSIPSVDAEKPLGHVKEGLYTLLLEMSVDTWCHLQTATTTCSAFKYHVWTC
jgi:hypothetical protein